MITCPSDKLRRELINVIADSTAGPGPLDTTFFARWTWIINQMVHFQAIYVNL